MKKYIKEKIAIRLSRAIYMADTYRQVSHEDITEAFDCYASGLLDAEAITRDQKTDICTICELFVKHVKSEHVISLWVDELKELAQAISTCGMTYDELLSESDLKGSITKALEKLVGIDYIRLLRQEEGVTEKDAFYFTCDF